MRHYMTALFLALAGTTPAMADSCSSVALDVRFCPEGDWTRLDLDLPDGIMVWKAQDVTAKLVMEVFEANSLPGTDDILDAIKAGVRASQDNPEDVTFYEHRLGDDGMFERGILAYDLNIGGKSMRMHHSFLRTEVAVLQFVTNARTANDAKNLLSHREFVTSFELGPLDQEA